MSDAQLIKENIALILELFKAIESDWAICDDNDEDSFMVLVNESRDTHKTLKPSKELVTILEQRGYIELDLNRSDEKGKPREFMEFFDNKKSAIPFVYFYFIAPKGTSLVTQTLSEGIAL